MVAFLENLSNGLFDDKQLELIMNHPDYEIEFLRYNKRVTKQKFKKYISKVLQLTEEQIEEEDLRVHHSCYLYFFKNIELYKKKILKLEQIFTPEFINQQFYIAKNGLPDNLNIGDITIIFTFGIGMSFGYPYVKETGENYIHFDVLQLIKDFSIDELKYQLAHEIHHIGVNQLHDAVDLSKISLEQLFLLYFSGEGLAVKYCNNAEGKLTKLIYPDKEPNLGLDHDSWKYLNDHFDDYFNHFLEHLREIRSRKLKNQEDLDQLINRFWMDAHTKEQPKDEPGKLKQLPLYSFGNELWGVIHDYFGKEEVYHLFYNLDQVIPLYNQALKALGKTEYLIPEK